MRLSLKTAKQLAFLMQNNSLPFSFFKKSEINMFLSEQLLNLGGGRNKRNISIIDKEQLANYLKHKFAINNLDEYISFLQDKDSTILDSAIYASDSKIKLKRNITGFLVNTISPIKITVNQQVIQLPMPNGVHCFISDYKKLQIPNDIIIVGIENAANFMYLKEQSHLFKNANYLFISRFPQSKDLIKWLISIPNKYVHFGDFDLAGMHIYLHEIKSHLNERASFFFPNNLPELFDKYANKKLFDIQYQKYRNSNFRDYLELKPLADIIYETGKCVEQQVLIDL